MVRKSVFTADPRWRLNSYYALACPDCLGRVRFCTRILVFIQRRRCCADGVRTGVGRIDSGIGISAGDQEKLFKPFQQANHTIAGTFGGTGNTSASSESARTRSYAASR